MATKKFKPYRTGTNDIYAKFEKKKQEDPVRRDNVKLFGFRSGKIYKMLPAILYYSFWAMYIAFSIHGEFTTLKFETADVILEIFKYSFIIIGIFSPAIFLSDFKYIDNIPIFKKRSAGSSFLGMLIVIGFCYCMMQVNIYCMSDTYKESLAAFEVEFEEQKAKAIEDMEQMTEETTVNTDK